MIFFQQLHGRTTGWVGMGISPNGAMTGADIVVGWVKEERTYITVSIAYDSFVA